MPTSMIGGTAPETAEFLSLREVSWRSGQCYFYPVHCGVFLASEGFRWQIFVSDLSFLHLRFSCLCGRFNDVQCVGTLVACSIVTIKGNAIQFLSLPIAPSMISEHVVMTPRRPIGPILCEFICSIMNRHRQVFVMAKN